MTSVQEQWNIHMLELAKKAARDCSVTRFSDLVSSINWVLSELTRKKSTARFNAVYWELALTLLTHCNFQVKIETALLTSLQEAFLHTLKDPNKKQKFNQAATGSTDAEDFGSFRVVLTKTFLLLFTKLRDVFRPNFDRYLAFFLPRFNTATEEDKLAVFFEHSVEVPLELQKEQAEDPRHRGATRGVIGQGRQCM